MALSADRMDGDHLAIRGIIFHLEVVTSLQLVVARRFPVAGDVNFICPCPHTEALGLAVVQTDQKVAMALFDGQHTFKNLQIRYKNQKRFDTLLTK